MKKNLSKNIGSNQILDNINLTFEESKIYGIVGRNGSGKTMLLKIICGFVNPTFGNVIIDNIDYYCNNDFPSKIRALIEHPKFINDLTGYENLKILAEIQNIINTIEINNILETVNLFDAKDKKYYSYS